MTIITSGSFTNVASTPYYLPLQQHVSYFKLTNASKLASYTSARITNVEWWDYMANGIAYVDAPTTITGPLNVSAVIRTQLAQNGISLYDSSVYSQGATVAISSFTPGTTTVFTTGTNHGYQVGDNVRVVGLTTAPQMGGLVMTVTATNGTNQFTTLFDSSLAVTSVGSVYKVGNVAAQNAALYYPQVRAVASISKASPMVVKTLVQQNYQVGDKVRFQIPTQYGMQQLNSTSSGLPVEFTVVAVNNAVGTQSVSLDVDSSAFTTFAWPASTNYPLSLPVMIPQGEWNLNNLSQWGVSPSPLPYANQNILGFARQNTASRGLLIGAGDGTAASSTGGIIGSTTDTWYWEAHTSQQQFPQI